MSSCLLAYLSGRRQRRLHLEEHQLKEPSIRTACPANKNSSHTPMAHRLSSMLMVAWNPFYLTMLVEQ